MSSPHYRTSNRRHLIILVFNPRLGVTDMQRALSVLPQGASIIGTHYNSVKCQHGLIVSHWAFDPVEPGQHLPEYAAHFNLTKGVWVERYDFDNSQWVKPGWLNVDRRSTTRKIFDYIFGT